MRSPLLSAFLACILPLAACGSAPRDGTETGVVSCAGLDTMAEMRVGECKGPHSFCGGGSCVCETGYFSSPTEQRCIPAEEFCPQLDPASAWDATVQTCVCDGQHTADSNRRRCIPSPDGNQPLNKRRLLVLPS